MSARGRLGEGVVARAAPVLSTRVLPVQRQPRNEHAIIGEARLKSAARIEIRAPASTQAGESLRCQVVVQNVGAGHNLPTSLTELREMWVDLKVTASDGRLLFHSGGLEPNGDIPAGAMRFGALAGDAQGNLAYKPWEVAQFLFKRLVPPKGSEANTFVVEMPEEVSAPIHLEATLFYRSAPPKVVAALMGDQAFEVKQVAMARAEASLAVGGFDEPAFLAESVPGASPGERFLEEAPPVLTDF